MSEIGLEEDKDSTKGPARSPVAQKEAYSSPQLYSISNQDESHSFVIRERRIELWQRSGRSWSILAGDNNLSEEMIYAIKEMCRIGVNNDFSVVAQFDPSGIGVPPKTIVIGRTRNDKDGIISKLVKLGSGAPKKKTLNSPNQNSADPKTLLEFIKSTIKDYKAQHYMVILSGHGNGVEGNFLTNIDPGDIDKDKVVTPPSTLSLTGLKWVFQQVRKENNGNPIDILGLDSCEMSMCEVAFQLKGNVNYMIGAEGTAFNTGWPYHRLLRDFRALLAKGRLNDPKKIAIRAAENYILYYQDYESTGMSTDQAALDLTDDRCNKLKKEVGNLADKLIKGLNKDTPSSHPTQDSILLAHWRAQSYGDEDYVDLWDFCNLLGVGRMSNDPILTACKKVKTSIEDNRGRGMVLKSCYSGAAFQHSHGVSIYFPWRSTDFLKEPKMEWVDGKIVPNSRYGYLDFARDNKWVEFLNNYVEVTCGEVRKGPGTLLQIEAPENAFILVRKNPPGGRGADLTDNPMKNPPRGFDTVQGKVS